MTDLSHATWEEIERTAKSCQKTWGMGFPVISVTLLRDILRKSKRSSQQNATLWGVIYPQILKHLPKFSADELHEFCLIEYFGSETVEIFGRKKLRPIRRSSRLSKTEFSDFMDWIVRFMAEKGIVLELPGEMDMRQTG